MFGGKHPFAAANPGRREFRGKRGRFLACHEIGTGAPGDLVERHTEKREPYQAQSDEGIVELEMSESHSSCLSCSVQDPKRQMLYSFPLSLEAHTHSRTRMQTTPTPYKLQASGMKPGFGPISVLAFSM